jgi:hypothetical protein
LTDSSFDDRLPEDLQQAADALRANRAVPDGHLLERVFTRVHKTSPHRPAWWLPTPRKVVTATLALACVIAAGMTHLNVVNEIGTLAGSVTTTKSTSSTGSAADAVYCTSNCAAPLTPGFWKNHESATSRLLPVKLGPYTVSTFSQAQAVFDAMNCSNSSSQGAFGCLAGQLLAAKLNVKNGGPTPTCATSAITSADTLLTSGGYIGPSGTYTLTATQRSQAVALANTLSTYNNKGTC